MKTYCVYKHTNNINSKSYIGMCAEQTMYRRWRNGEGYKGQNFYGDIEKYGWDAFEHVVLFSGLTKEEGIEKERECIELFGTTDSDKGYNVSKRADKPFIDQHHTEKSKKAISEKLKKYVKTEEHRKHIGEKVKGILHANTKPVYQYSINGEYITEWPYMNEAAKTLGISKGNISGCCLGRRKSAGGFVWRYERG